MVIKANKNILFFIKLLISGGLVVFLLQQIDIDKLITSIGLSRRPYLFLGYLLGIMNVLVCTVRWRMLLSKSNIIISYFDLMKAYFVGMFFNIFFPTGYGGDAVRGYKLYKKSMMMAASFSSVVVERIVGFSALISVSLISLMLSINFLNYKICLSVLGITIVFFATLGVFFNRKLFRRFGVLLKIFKFEKHREKIVGLYDTILSYKKYKFLLLRVYAISILSHCLMILSIYAFSLAIDLHIHIGYFFLFIPVINIITLVPVTLSGVGIREGGFVYFFSLIEVMPSDSFLISILFFSQLLFIGLIGCSYYLFTSDKNPGF